MKVLNGEFSRVILLDRSDVKKEYAHLSVNEMPMNSFGNSDAYRNILLADAVFFKDTDGSITVLKDRSYALIKE